MIGRDGSFRAGPLIGRPPGADDHEQLAAAQHVGAAQRRAAALEHAEELEQSAAGLEADARYERAESSRLHARATAIQNHSESFPSTSALQQREQFRATAAGVATKLGDDAEMAHRHWIEAAERAAAQRTGWEERTKARSLPMKVDALKEISARSDDAAATLRRSAAATRRLTPRLIRFITEVHEIDRTAVELPQLRTLAQNTHDIAEATAVELGILRDKSGSEAQEALDQHRAAEEERARLKAQESEIRQRVLAASNEVTRLTTKKEAAREAVEAAEPTAAAQRREMRAMLNVAGVSDALVIEEGSIDDDGLLDRVAACLEGRRRFGRKVLRERYDAARAALAGTWALDPGDGRDDLDTYALTYDDVVYTPYSAAVRAQDLKKRAQAALDSAEEAALRDFVVGRLPSAIGTAWIRLRDWVNDVNRKMRTAAASSGVGVQVRVHLTKDLSPSSRTVYELACQVADADRTREQQSEIGRALQQLISAADGESMHDKLAAAVDIRDWVDIHYEVTRPDTPPQRWSPKTGLSGGERRLVVLAPMLAAIAAAYDSLPADGLRLTALDEVPAEVDEQGREGLARYLAELDLDLICTSYLWDGAPGAWDGVDAYDLEGAEDGTVVGFPMLIRGIDGLPGDDDEAGVR